jgi:hypothetical protein
MTIRVLLPQPEMAEDAFYEVGFMIKLMIFISWVHRGQQGGGHKEYSVPIWLTRAGLHGEYGQEFIQEKCVSLKCPRALSIQGE